MDRDDYYDVEPGDPKTLAVDPALHNALLMQHERDRAARVRRWLANERAYQAVPLPAGVPDRITELERVEADRRQRLTAELLGEA